MRVPASRKPGKGGSMRRMIVVVLTFALGSSTGAGGLGRRQLRGPAVGRRGGSGARRAGQRRGEVQAPRGRNGAAVQGQRERHRKRGRGAHPLRCRRSQRPGRRHPVLGASGRAVEGTLAEGTITAPDPGNACGWVDLAAVLAAMESGATRTGRLPAHAGTHRRGGGGLVTLLRSARRCALGSAR
jgi:hypothetical protein